jgi:hypothetical protein
MNAMLKFFAKIALGRLHDYVDSLTEADKEALVTRLNKVIGGDKKLEAATVNILIIAVKTLLDIVKL